MLISKQNLLKLRKELKLERIYNIVVAAIIIFILVAAFAALKRPVTGQQRQVIVELSRMANNPETQKMANQLLQTGHIDRADYFKLMRAYQFENAKAKHYPAMAQEDE